MAKYCSERLESLKRLYSLLAPATEVNQILESLRDELRRIVTASMESCVLLLDPEADAYTRPLQCALYDRPVNCLACKRNRAAVQKALAKGKGVVVSRVEPIRRADGSRVLTGPEMAIPVLAGDSIVAVITVVSRPGAHFENRDFLMVKDIAELAGNVILSAKRHWEVTREKLALGRALTSLAPFVPQTVRSLAESRPEDLAAAKEQREVTVLFLDLEGYTALCGRHGEAEAIAMVERLFSRFVDPIHRSGGEINETAGDGLMIIFKNHDRVRNAVDAVKAALDIRTVMDQERARAGEPEALTVNIGISSGLAYLGTSRFVGAVSSRMTYTASGQVTNLAARLADLAGGGEILITRATRDLIAGAWETQAKGAVKLKGVSQEVEVFALEGTKPA